MLPGLLLHAAREAIDHACMRGAAVAAEFGFCGLNRPSGSKSVAKRLSHTSGMTELSRLSKQSGLKGERPDREPGAALFRSLREFRADAQQVQLYLALVTASFRILSHDCQPQLAKASSVAVADLLDMDVLRFFIACLLPRQQLRGQYQTGARGICSKDCGQQLCAVCLRCTPASSKPRQVALPEGRSSRP